VSLHTPTPAVFALGEEARALARLGVSLSSASSGEATVVTVEKDKPSVRTVRPPLRRPEDVTCSSASGPQDGRDQEAQLAAALQLAEKVSAVYHCHRRRLQNRYRQRA
jgi:hypothetical protein